MRAAIAAQICAEYDPVKHHARQTGSPAISPSPPTTCGNGVRSVAAAEIDLIFTWRIAPMPARFQQSRIKGWTKPVNGRCVSRPSQFGNETIGRKPHHRSSNRLTWTCDRSLPPQVQIHVRSGSQHSLPTSPHEIAVGTGPRARPNYRPTPRRLACDCRTSVRSLLTAKVALQCWFSRGITA